MRKNTTKILGIEIEKGTPWYYGIIVLIIIIAVYVFKYLRKVLAGITAKNDGLRLSHENDIGNIALGGAQVRSTQFLSSVADTIRKEIKAMNQDEALIVKTLNTLLNKEEVSVVSAYYRSAYGSSLKSDVEGALDSPNNFFARAGWKTTWNHLADHVKNYLT